MEERSIKVLLVEDNPDDTELLQRKLGKSANGQLTVTSVKSLHDALEHLAQNKPDIILSDLGLPDSHGLDTVTKIMCEAPNIPLVVLSGFDDEATAIKAVQSGAQDYLVKGQLEGMQIERSLFYAIERGRLQTELEQHTQEISKVQANLLKILDKNADAIMVVSRDKRIIFANPAAESLLGQTKKDLIDKPFDFPLDGGKTAEIEIRRRGQEKTIAEISTVEINWEGRPAFLASMRNITKRKRVEEELRISEEKYRNIVELAPEGIVTVNTTGKITSCNKAFLKMAGFPEEKILDKHFTKIPSLKAKDIPSYVKLSVSVLSGKTQMAEVQWSHADGTKRVCELRFSLMKLKGRISGIQVIAIDITERKKSEQALKESEAKFSKAFHSSANLFAINKLKDGNFIEINEAFTRMTGYTRKEVIGRNAVDLNLWADEEERTRIVKKTWENDRVRNEQIKIRNKSGETRMGLFSSEKITISGEACLIHTITDITELKRIEESLRVSEDKFSKSFRHSPEGIVISSIEDGTILEANDTFLRLSGYTHAEVVGRKSIELGLWATPEERVEIIKLLKKKGTVSNRECQFRMKSGEVRFLLFSAEIIIIDGNPCMLSVTVDITERKKVEEKLRFSDTALNSIQEGVFASDNEFRITRWNEMCEQMFGIKASDATGKNVGDVFSMVEEYPGQNLKRYELLMAKGFNKEEQIYRTPRGNIWVDVHVQAIEDNGKRYGWVTLVSDISERKKTEEALCFSHAAFRSIHESVIATNMKYVITEWNEISEQIYGVKAADAIGKKLTDVIEIMENLPGENERRLKKLEADGFLREEQLHRTKYGDVWVDSSIQSIESDHKRYGWVILSSAITQRKLAEEALKRSEEKYRELISTSIDGIISADSQMRIMIWNQGAEKIFGYTEKEMLGQSVFKIVPEKDRAMMGNQISLLSKTDSKEGMSGVLEFVGQKKDGSYVPIEMSISIRKNEGAYIATAIIRDVTERKEAEEKLRKIERMKSEFLSNVSHELRTPLQSISGFTKLIMNGQVPDPATQQEFFQIIDREAQHLGNLINGLLDMSRLESGKFQINRKPTDIRDTVIDSIKSFHTLARDKNITLNEEIPAELPEMQVDDERMRQVFVNLLSNAIKYSDSGGSITVRAEKHPGELLFQVSDDGIGMSPETMKHLFERFYRADDNLARSGTGLGLYITKQIIDAHGGRIWAESRVNEGSTFSFTMPFDGKGGNGHGKKNIDHRRRSGNIKTG